LSIAYTRAMPAPVRTSRDAIVRAASHILEEAGLDAVTMAAVAERVGVRGPSLYKHIPNRAMLVRAIAEDVARQLGATIERAIDSSVEPRRGLRAAVAAQRSFVRAHPNGYGLLFAHLLPESMPDTSLVASVGLPVVRRMGELVGEEHALAAARALVAWAHGFVSMELAGAFRLGGDVDAAFDFGVDAVLDGVMGTED
jgi:AcrR family transcriptional regulator